MFSPDSLTVGHLADTRLQGETVAKVRLAEAARIAGIARSTLYEKYINTGKISVESENRDGKDHRVIDTAELHRIFGDNLHLSDVDNSLDARGIRTRNTEDVRENNTLQATVEVLQEQLRAAQERERAHQDRERWYQGQLESLTGAIKLLEHRGATDSLPADTAMVEAERVRVAELEAQLAAERSRGFFSRVFGGKR
jgi:hypothetical protein